MEYYVYILRDPRKNNEPFYVGKGKGDRSNHHIKKYDTHNKFKNNVIDKILNEGLNVITEYYKFNLKEKEALDLEINLISKIGRRDKGTGPLTNLTDGGEGVSGYIRSEESRKKLNQERIDSGVYIKIANKNRGRKFSDEHRKKLSESHKGLGQSEETKKKRADKLRGIKRSEELKKQWSENKKGNKNPMFGKPSPNKGKSMSQEQKDKIRQSILKRIKEKKQRVNISKENIMVRTMQGREIDLDKLMRANELTPAVGNMQVNARGDQLGTGGQIVKKREEVVAEYYEAKTPKRKPSTPPVADPAPAQTKKTKPIENEDEE